MNQVHGLRRTGGALLALGGLALFFAGVLHPQGASGNFAETMASMLASPTWAAAHWLAVVGGLTIVWAVWLLVDSGWTARSVIGHVGARLVVLGGLFMAVEFSAELAAAPESAAYVAGAVTPMGALVEAMQTVGWPAFMLGFVVLIAGLPASAPAVVRWAGVLGATAMGFGGFLTEGLHVLAAGPLFIGGNLLALWLVWVGVTIVLASRATAVESRGVQSGEIALTT